ncbi:MAG: 2-isopropylmalate synthase [Microcoleaceae cyanobacterium]
MIPITLFDTTLRDGELMPGVRFDVAVKVKVAQLLESAGIGVIEVGYPGQYSQDFQAMVEVAKVVERSTICGLSGSREPEIYQLAKALETAKYSRINLYTLVNLKASGKQTQPETVLSAIQTSVSLAKDACDEVQWSAFDATRSDLDFLCQAIELAIQSGAKIVTIPDSLGVASPESFLILLSAIFTRVPKIDQVVVSVHCHNDLGQAVAMSLIGLDCGVRQIECAIQGLGARKGNANLWQIAQEINNQRGYQVKVDDSLIHQAENLITSCFNKLLS